MVQAVEAGERKVEVEVEPLICHHTEVPRVVQMLVVGEGVKGVPPKMVQEKEQEVQPWVFLEVVVILVEEVQP